MYPEILQWMDRAKRVHNLKALNILEVGSYDVNGSPRSVFQADSKSYLGVDIAAGPGVDVVMSAADFTNDTLTKYDMVICCEMLEHDRDYMWTLECLKSALKDGGYLILTTPTFDFPLHRHPKDYWRFGEDAYRDVLLADMEILSLEFTTNETGHRGIAALARKKA